VQHCESVTPRRQPGSLPPARRAPILTPFSLQEETMTKSEHLQFLALMIPTVLLLVLAAVSLADPDIESVIQQPAIYAPAEPVDDAGHETAY
jgi:hypothetical protein